MKFTHVPDQTVRDTVVYYSKQGKTMEEVIETLKSIEYSIIEIERAQMLYSIFDKEAK